MAGHGHAARQSVTPQPARIPRRADAAVGAGASVHVDLKTPPDTGLLSRLGYRFGRRDTIRLWGNDLHVPAHRMAPHWLWAVRRQTYERDEASALLEALDPAMPLVELGGGFGAISVLVNARLQDPANHVVVEMDGEMVDYLHRNRDANGSHYEVVHAAVSSKPVWLDVRRDFVGQQASAQGGVIVPNVHPDQLVRDRGWDRINLFMDIEGMEVDLVAAFPDFFRDHVEVLVMETHGHKAPTAEVAALPLRLHELGLQPIWTRGRVWAYRAR